MISYILLVVSIVIVLISWFLLLVDNIRNNNKRIDNVSGFDVAKEITSSYDLINIVRANGIMFSEYDINRNVIRLNNKNYDGNSYNDLINASILAGFSLVNKDNDKYFKFNFLFKKIRSTNIVSFIMLVVSYFVVNIGDAKLGLVLFFGLLIYQYMRYQIMVMGNIFVDSNLDKDIYDEIQHSLVRYVNFYKLSFIAGLIMVLRLIVIIMGI